uniref:Uncharacterized protein n=1 Tax=Kalanchoe fedtschenkoi TaxID=63787 RepID=A0A7N0U072_KALFE
MAANVKARWVVLAVFILFLVLQPQASSARLLSSDLIILPVDKQQQVEVEVGAPNTRFAGRKYAPLVLNMLPKSVRVPPSGPSKGTNGMEN